MKNNKTNICAGIPTKNSIHKLVGGVGKNTVKVKNNDRIVDQTNSEMAKVFTQTFFQTAVKISKIINVIGNA